MRGRIIIYFLFILLIIFGMALIFKPSEIWLITESWKSRDATEPSDIYIWSIRFGGVLCTAAAVAGICAISL